jgi:hypothetical protein
MVSSTSHKDEGRTNTSRMLIAIVIALGLMGAVTITIFIVQIAEARGCENGKAASQAVNKSLGRCFGH